MKAAAGERVALLALGLAVGLGAAEVGLRLWARSATPLAWKLREWDPDATRLELLGSSCYRARPGSVLHFPNGTVAHVNRSGFRGPDVAVPKPAGTYRVVVLGGSTTHGFGVDDDQTIDAHLRRALTAAGRRVEVVNLGLDGNDALCDAERLRLEGVAFEPDALVIHSGVNDVAALRADALAPNDLARGFRADRRRAEEAGARERGLWRWLKHRLFLARVPGVVRHFRAAAPAALPGPAAPAAAALDAFAATMRAMAALVPPPTAILVSMPPSAPLVPGVPPGTCGAAVVDALTTRRYRERLDERLQQVAAELTAAGRPATYVPHHLPAAAFLDECHLTGEGNRLLAADFARVLAPRVLSGAAAGDMSGTP